MKGSDEEIVSGDGGEAEGKTTDRGGRGGDNGDDGATSHSAVPNSPLSPFPDLALCYYKSSTSRERSGWIFLSDVISVGTDPVDRWVEVRHPSRTYRLRASDKAVQRRWLDALRALCQAGHEGGEAITGEGEPKLSEGVESELSKESANERVSTLREILENHDLLVALSLVASIPGA